MYIYVCVSILQRAFLSTVRLRRSLVVTRSSAAHDVTRARKLLSCFHRTSLARFSPKLLDEAKYQTQQVSKMYTLTQQKPQQWTTCMREVIALAMAGSEQEEGPETDDGVSIVLRVSVLMFEGKVDGCNETVLNENFLDLHLCFH